MSVGGSKYRRLMAGLDTIGITVCILKIGYRRYQWLVNYEVISEHRQRRTCNNKLVKLYNNHKGDIEKDGNQ